MYAKENVLVEILVLKIYYFNIEIIYITSTVLRFALFSVTL